MAALQLAHVTDQQVRFERIGMVVVERGALLEAQVVAIAIVAIVLEQRHVFGTETVDDPPHDGRLP